MKIKNTKVKFKKSIFAFIDMLATKKLISKRPDEVKKSNLEPIKTKYHINELVEQIHPKKQFLQVSKLENISNTVKLVRLTPINGKKIAIFRPGQYINISFDVDGKKISRPYSIASSLKDAIDYNYYDLVIKYKADGYISKYVHSYLKVGDVLVCNAPSGEFFYSKLRDSKNTIALVGGIGISPIYSITKWINDYNLDINLTILYSNVNESEMVYAREIEEISAKNSHIKINHFITKQSDTKYTNHRISFNDIKKIPNYETSTFLICGSNKFVEEFKYILLSNGIKQKFIRTESKIILNNLESYQNYSNIGNKKIYKITIRYRDEFYYIDALADETLFSSIQRANLPIKSSCLSGKCSMCRVRLVKGEIFVPKNSCFYRKSDYINKIIYTCSVYPITDLEIDML